MTYPILEFDTAPEVFIEPSKVIRARALPEHYAICFFKEVIEACEFYFDYMTTKIRQQSLGSLDKRAAENNLCSSFCA